MPKSTHTQAAHQWFAQQNWKPFPFQIETWNAYLLGKNGVVNAPTGSGKTYSLVMPILLEFLQEKKTKKKNGLRAIWITPIRALAKEIEQSAQRAIDGLGMDWRVGVRTGDTSTKERQAQKKNPPEFLITTPESLHLLMASKGYENYFKNLKVVVTDEWHELIGSKRGVQVELALSRFRGFLPQLKTWGISATIGNMEEAVEVLMGGETQLANCQIIRTNIRKKIKVESLLPDTMDTFPWAGHLGIKMLDKTKPILLSGQTTLIFTNTRTQCEIWYKQLLEAIPELAGVMAMHHGSMSRDIRNWVEESLHTELLKVVVCTSSLDLGVDFRPVENIIQVGSPKGVARFLQRAGRSGHRPGATSKIYFVPAHALELIEATALQEAMKRGLIEQRIPYKNSFDVLVQYMVTLAVSDGFESDKIYKEVIQTYSYKELTKDEWQWLLDFLLTGGEVLAHYNDYQKVVIEDGLYKVNSRRTATRHRLSIGTIVSDTMLSVKYLKGGRIGNVEEWFIAQFKPKDVFWFAGRCLELVRIKEMTVYVRNSKKTKGKIPSWMGGRLPLSSQLTEVLRDKISDIHTGKLDEPELKALKPLLDLQQKTSHIPAKTELLIEYFESKEGHHLLFYPFEGRFVHEGLGALLAYRISQRLPISFSIAMNDYGFELLSDQKIDLAAYITPDLFSTQNLVSQIEECMNITELANRQFRDIAAISGMVFKGYPGKQKKDRHLQASSGLLFQVFQEHDAGNLLLQQAYAEVRSFQLEEVRLRNALERLQSLKRVFTYPVGYTPFSFPIVVDRMREKVSSEKLEDRIRKMLRQ